MSVIQVCRKSGGIFFIVITEAFILFMGCGVILIL